ncbi:alpha/beta hydrolase fold domain-containing protein [Corticibacterium sp. UT-5YL-CI-8]|nr:alpha/beta hydrolase fold domain-containing protein [Tianweitania sp. UT-5YL-CI-8]
MFETITIGERDGSPLHADLYRPEGINAPLIVAASGGGWRRGGRQGLDRWGQYFAKSGFAFASVDYARAASGSIWPRNAEDVAAGLSYFGRDGARHGVDVERIGALGVSAGAHLTALALLSHRFETPQVRCFAGIYGVYDLMAHWQADLAAHAKPGEDPTERMLGATPFDDPQRFHDASPLRQITYGKAMPVFLSWGHADRDVSPQQSAAFATALKQAGYAVRCREFKEAGHFWFSEEDPEHASSLAAQVAPDLLRFFERSLAAETRALTKPARAIG